MSRQSDSAYATIATAIRYLRAHAGRQPRLDELAAELGLSSFHLQRVFSEWAGISPKRFVQALTRDHARRLLAESHAVLDVALASGLSGSGRLHDLLLACDAVTPGEAAAHGKGLLIRCGVAETPFGPALIGDSGRGVCHFAFMDAEQAAPDPVAALSEAWPEAEVVADPERAAALADLIFPAAALAVPQPLHLFLRGTNFQIKVWQALLAVPEGRLITYGRLAAALGQPRAARAVGRAVGSNALALLIPCHRVIRESGEYGGYRWGLERKAALLGWETAGTQVG